MPGYKLRRGQLRRDIAIVITDGNSNVGGDPSGCADQLAAGGIEVFAIGVGSGISRSELLSIASSPPGQHVVSVRDFSALDSIVDSLEGFVCPGECCRRSLQVQVTSGGLHGCVC